MPLSEFSPSAWLFFAAIVTGILALDLGLFYRKPRVISLREALWATSGYVTLALCFNLWIYWNHEPAKSIEFLTSYFIEYTLSMDNILVFVIILAYFQVPPQSQMRVLLWGIIGALILRGVFIFAGLALIEIFSWLVIPLGLFLIYTGIRTIKSGDKPKDLKQSRIVQLIQKFIPMTSTYDGGKFFTKKGSRRVATPLFLVFVVLNVTDILFAVDSVPAVFAITRDPFIVYTSNVFAILGLRSLYFALAGIIHKFRYLKLGLALVLIFIGAKMIFNYPDWLPDIPTELALIITALLIFGSIFLSFVVSRREQNGGNASAPK